MFRIEAPFPNIQTTTILPSPEFGNSSGLVATVQILRSMDGTAYVYKKNKQNRRKFQWSFTISRHKAIELREFIKVYYGSAIKIIDHLGDEYIVYLQNNPLDLSSGARAGGFPGDETQQVTLEFEEKI